MKGILIHEEMPGSNLVEGILVFSFTTNLFALNLDSLMVIFLTLNHSLYNSWVENKVVAANF